MCLWPMSIRHREHERITCSDIFRIFYCDMQQTDCLNRSSDLCFLVTNLSMLMTK
jgi:hypothetical protein